MAQRFQVVVSVELLQELAEVLDRPRFRMKYRLHPSDIAEFIALLSDQAVPVVIAGHLHICRDPKDNMVIETAIAGKAEALVTRDDDLKHDPQMVKYLIHHGVRVFSISTFLRHYRWEI